MKIIGLNIRNPNAFSRALSFWLHYVEINIYYVLHYIFI